ncbi:hypothetical protein D6D29_00703 [Aureobasidium pullulans]|nr:hypothetical protein D6D29_00703 [Aureobasidium pullulans]
MNISQWIDDLEQANQPSESPAFINQHRATRKHGQGSGKGSLLEPFVDRVRHTRRTHPPESPRASNSATSSVTRPSSSSSSSSSSSTPSSSSSKRYQRKPRHHTKADKYHPKRKRRSHSKEKAKKQSKKKEKNAKRPHRRKHNSEVITGVVQSFHAKNVPKNRLTLKPSSKVGLYTKGRSSGPTRGKGLPDLVFSEMRFLQNPEPIGKEKPERKSKKKHKKRHELSEKEISRYFDSSKTQPEYNDRSRERHTTPLDATAPAAEAVKLTHTTSPVVLNLSDKPFLGFGSRGTHPPTTSYYSWSDSGRASSSLAKQIVPTFQPLAVGELQRDWSQSQTQAVPVEQNATQHLPVRQTADTRDGGSHDRTPEPVPDTNQAIIQPAKARLHSVDDERPVSETVSKKRKSEMRVPMHIVEPESNHNHANANMIGRAPSMRENDRLEGPLSTRSKVPAKADSKQYSEPWEELLQDCEVAARAPISAWYEDSLPQHIRYVSHEYANLQLWRPSGGNLWEYDYGDNFVGELVCPDQPEVVGDGEGDDLSYGDIVESLLEESQRDYDMPAGDEAYWEEGNASRHDGVQGYQIEDAEPVDEFATFWQPNILY